MATPNNSAFEIGSYFINQYYQVLSETPEFSYRFYSDSSTMTRVDGDDTQTVSTMLDIHSLLTSLSITKIEVTQLNVQNSWNGGILLIVSGVVRSRNFYGKRKFTQAFFLAPQDNGFFLLNDILHFQDEDVINQHSVPELPDVAVDSEVHAYNTHLEQPVSDYKVEEETRDYVNSLHIEDDSPIDKYSLPDEEHEEFQPETVVKEAPVEQYSSLDRGVNHVEDPLPAPALAPAPTYEPASEPASGPADEPVSEPAGERAKLSYASILQASKGQSFQSFAPRQAAVRQSMPPSSPLLDKASTQQLNPSVPSFVPEVAIVGPDDGLVQEVELTSVYVRNLPSHVTNTDLEKEFKHFGKIKPNGVFIRNKTEIGVCFAFVEYEDMSGVHNAIQASPIEILGRQVYIEERKASSSNGTRGGAVARGRGRGRGNFQNETSRGRGGVRNPGRGSALNDIQQRTYQ